VKDSLRYEKGRYRVAVPWKDEKPELPDTEPMALSRLRSTERNLKKDDMSPKIIKQLHVSRPMLNRGNYDRLL